MISVNTYKRLNDKKCLLSRKKWASRNFICVDDFTLGKDQDFFIFGSISDRIACVSPLTAERLVFILIREG